MPIFSTPHHAGGTASRWSRSTNLQTAPSKIGRTRLAPTRLGETPQERLRVTEQPRKREAKSRSFGRVCNLLLTPLVPIVLAAGLTTSFGKAAPSAETR